MRVLSIVLLGVLLVLLGISWAAWVSLSATFLGVSAVVVGGVILVENVLWPWYSGHKNPPAAS